MIVTKAGPSLAAINAHFFETVSQARERAGEAKKLLKRGMGPKTYLLEALVGEIERTVDPEKDGWTWEQGRDAFLEEIRKTHPPATYHEYRKTLAPRKFKDLDALTGKLLKAITDDDIRRCQLAAWKRDKLDQSHHILRTLKACLSWLIQQPDSGIKVSVAAGVKFLDKGRLAKAETGKKLGKLRSGEEIARMVWALQRADAAPRLAASLCLFTVQRIGTVLRAHKSEILAAPKAGGGMWDISACAYQRQETAPAAAAAGIIPPHEVGDRDVVLAHPCVPPATASACGRAGQRADVAERRAPGDGAGFQNGAARQSGKLHDSWEGCAPLRP